MSKTTADIRQMFLDYFQNKGHQVVPSSSLVPANDPTLLFTNAGMNQFKDVFLGLDQRSYHRATTAQRCVRAGGKHNDLENVGYTARHHTFFEMLGNFSFGDYFKEDAIKFAWELLTGKNWFNLPEERLWVTVYASDDEAYDIWASKMGVPKERIIRIGDNKGAPYASDNFWQMGDTGPCGPCTEIFYDHGDHIWGGPPGSPEEDGDRYIEIWNIVFMQYNRHADGSMDPLPKPSVDTGMGLERISAVLQGVHSNYEIDVFKTLIQAAADIIGVKDLENKSLRVIADHIRSCAFLIADGVLPSNEGRGYVLRRIIRRAVRHGNMLNAKQAFFYRLVEPLINVMGDAANDLEKQKKLVEQVLKAEEEQFSRTLDRGLQLLDEELEKVKNNVLSGEAAFKLYDTYGFPLDLTADVCRERNIVVDEAGFEKEMNLQRERARTASGFSMDYNQTIKIDKQSKFIGYSENSGTSQITSILHQAKQTSTVKEGDEAVIFLEDTPFYAESGGQIGDKGRLVTPSAEFEVVDTQKYGKAIGHIGKVIYGTFNLGDKVSADIDIHRRDLIRLNHSATHLLHAALRRLLGDNVSQKGSLVTDNSLRFDFSSMNPVTPEQLMMIENDVNAQIRRNLPISTEKMDIEAARNKGAMALFGEKYDDVVRVLSMGDYSIELCGGTHAGRTGDIGLFRIVSESGIAAGIRRIEAVTGPKAIELMHQDTLLIQQLSGLLKGDKNSITDKVSTLLDNVKQLEKSLDKFKEQQIAQTGSSLASTAILVNKTKVLISDVPTMEIKQLRTLLDDLKNQLGKAIIVLSMSDEGKSALIVGITKELTSKVKAGEIVAALIAKTGGKGGGRPDMAQAGGCDSEILAKSLLDLPNWLSERL